MGVIAHCHGFTKIHMGIFVLCEDIFCIVLAILSFCHLKAIINSVSQYTRGCYQMEAIKQAPAGLENYSRNL